jgi:hypothetical protein
MIRIAGTRIVLALLSCIGLFDSAQSHVRAESAIPLLAGFDEARFASIFAEPDSPKLDELAKLLYRIDKTSVPVLSERAGATINLGDAITVSGKVISSKRHTIPAEFVEFLDFKSVDQVELNSDDQTLSTVSVYMIKMPLVPQPGDSITGIGIVVNSDATDLSLATKLIQWTPFKPKSPGIGLLGELDVDIASVERLGSRNRQPLQSDDGDPFYAMLSAAPRAVSAATPPANFAPARLLQEPLEQIGNWLRFQAETVRITRVIVTDPERQQQLGSDAYFQIDSMSDLGNVVVKLERPVGEPVVFENRFPVSLVVTQLPTFLRNAMVTERGELKDVAMVSRNIEVDGFFFRLWSYESDRMNREGKGEQIGPLVVAAEIRPLKELGPDPLGVSRLGVVIVGAIALGVIGVWIWNIRNARLDAEVKRRRIASDEIILP